MVGRWVCGAKDKDKDHLIVFLWTLKCFYSCHVLEEICTKNFFCLLLSSGACVPFPCRLVRISCFVLPEAKLNLLL